MEILLTDDICLRELTWDDTEAIFYYYLKNREFHQPWFPEIENYYTEEFHKKSLENYQTGILMMKTSFKFGLFKDTEALGHCNVTAIERGVFQNCRLGYSIDEHYAGKGLMTKMVGEITDFCFKSLNLHRVEANIMPRNLPSQRVLEKNDFKKIGQSPEYLLINGRWENHDHYMKLNENFKIVDVQ